MRHLLSVQLNRIIFTILLLIVALTPLIFAPFTTEYFEIPKVVFLVVAVLVLLVLWALSWVLGGKVLVTRTPLDISLLLFLGIVLLSTFFYVASNGNARLIAVMGNLPRLHGSAVTWVAYILFFFILTSNVRSQAQVKTMFYALLTSSTVVAVISLLSYFGLYLPLPFAATANFTPTGSSFSTSAMLVLLLPLPLLSLINPNRFMPLPAAIALSTLYGITIALTGSLATWAATVAALGLTLFVTKRSEIIRSIPFLLIPVVVSLLVFVLGWIPTPNNSNPFNVKRLNFPREIQLSFPTSWKVSASAFRDAPFLGTGPSTYLFNFTAYKPIEQNATRFWNVRFDTAFNEYLQALGTLGGLGLLALVFLSVMIFSFAWRGFAHAESNLAVALSISAVVSLVLMLLHVTTPVMMVTVLALLGLLAATHKSLSGKVEELQLGIKASKLTDSNLVVGDILPIILFIPILVFVLVALWNVVKVVNADYHHRLALNSATTRGLDTYNHLIEAERQNRWVDLYRTDLAQTNFALANAIAAAKGPTQASPSGSLTDQDRQNIRQLLSQSINEARAATALSPRSAQNWEILGSIYRQISGVAQNALAFSLDAYGRAIQRDPLNPVLRLTVGGIYYSAKNYDLAIRFFADAANLKPDYANAYYNLSVALRDKGDLQSAQAAAEKALSLVDPKSNDYKLASEYLTDLKARVATGSAKQQAAKPTTEQQQSALQGQNLPKVLDEELKDTPDTATPAAVRRNPNNPIETPATPAQ